MARKSLVLTPGAIEALSEGYVPDPQTPGLSIHVQAGGRRVWKYRRRLRGSDGDLKKTLGYFPALSIAEARKVARAFNDQIDAGIDPSAADRERERLSGMTVFRAHELYMEAVRQGRASRSKRPNKPRTIADKLVIFERDIAPKLGAKIIYDVTERDLINLVEAKGAVARVRANRLAAELKVFFGWAASLRGLSVELQTDPSRRLGDLKFPERPRSRKLSMQEVEWFLIALAQEQPVPRRGLLMCLLTAARISEVTGARTAEVVDGVWTIPAARVKNSSEHRIALGPWGEILMRAEGEWVFPNKEGTGPRSFGWYKVRNRIHRRMEKLAGHSIEQFTPHDLRRTVRSNTKRLNFDFETAEAMLNHLKAGMERTYDRYDLEQEKRAWFLTWENEILSLARKASVADLLQAPSVGLSEDYCEIDKASASSGLADVADIFVTQEDDATSCASLAS